VLSKRHAAVLKRRALRIVTVQLAELGPRDFWHAPVVYLVGLDYAPDRAARRRAVAWDG